MALNDEIARHRASSGGEEPSEFTHGQLRVLVQAGDSGVLDGAQNAGSVVSRLAAALLRERAARFAAETQRDAALAGARDNADWAKQAIAAMKAAETALATFGDAT